MEHHHHHHDHAAATLNRVGKAFIAGIFLNSAFVIIEFGAGFYSNSLALLSDAGHNLSDVASLALALLAYRLAKKKATSRYTFGFHKSTVLASLVNAIILLIAVGSIGWEAIQRFAHPEPTKGAIISIVAGAGIIINGVSAFLFYKDKESDLNAKGAFLHLATDALVSLGVVVAGILISFTGALWIDPLISLLVMIVVIYTTWGLLRESLNLSIDAVPRDIDLEKVKQRMQQVKGVAHVHHIHVWAIGTTKNALTAHLVLEKNLEEVQVVEIKNQLRHALERLNIQHATLETELKDNDTGGCEQNETGAYISE
jgi:cobalt-zinc-cadmium efflux system protein